MTAGKARVARVPYQHVLRGRGRDEENATDPSDDRRARITFHNHRREDLTARTVTQCQQALVCLTGRPQAAAVGDLYISTRFALSAFSTTSAGRRPTWGRKIRRCYCCRSQRWLPSRLRRLLSRSHSRRRHGRGTRFCLWSGSWRRRLARETTGACGTRYRKRLLQSLAAGFGFVELFLSPLKRPIKSVDERVCIFREV